MKRNLKLIALLLLFSVASCSFTTKSFDDPDKDKTLLDLIAYLLERGHYDAKDINDEFSANVFDDYIDALDPYRRFFYKKDIEEFEKYKTQIDDAIRDKDLSFFDLTYNRLIERTEEANKIQEELLKKPFDFEKEEILNTEYEKQPFAKNKKELKNRWRQQLKLNALSSYYDLREDQEKVDEEGDDKEAAEPKEILSNEELEVKAREEVADNTKEFFEFTLELERKDWFAVFLNAIVEEFDPHTYYFAPVAKDRFDTQMSGQFQGIGARLQKKGGEVRITDIISGGPAWRGDELPETRNRG